MKFSAAEMAGYLSQRNIPVIKKQSFGELNLNGLNIVCYLGE